MELSDSLDQDIELAIEMKEWLFADGEPGDEALTIAILDDRYQDDGHTSRLLLELKDMVGKARRREDLDPLLEASQEWFERIDPVMNGYATQEEALANIYGDDGYTADFYRRLRERNENRSA